MAFCTKCGARFEAGAAFCGDCGAALAAAGTVQRSSPENARQANGGPADSATPGRKPRGIRLHDGIIIFIVALTAATPIAYRQYTKHTAIKDVQTQPYTNLNGTPTTIGQMMKDGYPKGEWFASKESNGTFTVAFRADEPFSSVYDGTNLQSIKLCLAREECKAVLVNAQNNCSSAGDAEACMAQQLSQAANTLLPVIVRWTVGSDHSVQSLSNNLGL